MRSICFALAFSAFAATLTSGATAQPATDPGMGTWKLNAAKSAFKPGPAPRSLTTRFEPAGPGVKWSAERVGDDAKTAVSEFTANYDGKDYPVKGSPATDAVTLRRIDALTTERVNKKEGKVVTTEVRQVAADGKSYTTTVKGTTSRGEPIDHRMVFDRQ